MCVSFRYLVGEACIRGQNLRVTNSQICVHPENSLSYFVLIFFTFDCQYFDLYKKFYSSERNIFVKRINQNTWAVKSKKKKPLIRSHELRGFHICFYCAYSKRVPSQPFLSRRQRTLPEKISLSGLEKKLSKYRCICSSPPDSCYETAVAALCFGYLFLTPLDTST